MTESVLTNAIVVTRDDSFLGTVVIGESHVRQIDTGTSAQPGAEDCQGDLLIPGLIEMHTDNVERHMEPRPGVIWPSPLAALIAHDTEVIGAGITTVLDAISVGAYDGTERRRALLTKTHQGLKFGKEEDLFRADHFMHMRCEVSDRSVVELFEPYATDPIVRLMSVMDHTPGQRQWQDLAKMRQFHSRRRVYTDKEFESYVRERQEYQTLYSGSHRRRVIELWRPRNLPFASHDDTTTDHIEESFCDGVTIAEFPTTMTAAIAAHNRGMTNVMGSPNLIRGESHSGNVSAVDLAGRDILDALSSDYAPSSLLHGAVKLSDEYHYPLHKAVATVTANVADMLNFDDCGEIVVGKRADLVRVRRASDGSACVRAVWRAGRRVFG